MEMDLDAIESISNITSPLAMVYLTGALVFVTNRYVKLVKTQTDIIREDHEKEKNTTEAMLEAMMEKRWNFR
jgi:hypothetical protein